MMPRLAATNCSADIGTAPRPPTLARRADPWVIVSLSSTDEAGAGSWTTGVTIGDGAGSILSDPKLVARSGRAWGTVTVKAYGPTIAYDCTSGRPAGRRNPFFFRLIRRARPSKPRTPVW